MKSRNARSVKQEKERLKKHMIEREWHECSINRKRTLEVKMQYNITRLSKEKRMNSLTQEAHNRISKEKELQEEFYMKTQAKLVELKQLSEQERHRLELMKMRRSGIQEQYREMTESRADVRVHIGSELKKPHSIMVSRKSQRLAEIRTAEQDQAKPSLRLNLSCCNKDSERWRVDKSLKKASMYQKGEDSLESIRLEEEPTRLRDNRIQEITANSNSSRFRNYTNREENKQCISEIAEKYNIRYDFNSLEDFELQELQKNKQLTEEILKQERSIENEKREERVIGKLSKQPMIEEINKKSLSNIQEKSRHLEGRSSDQVSNPPELNNEVIVVRDAFENEPEPKRSSLTSIFGQKQGPEVAKNPEIGHSQVNKQSPKSTSLKNSFKKEPSAKKSFQKQESETLENPAIDKNGPSNSNETDKIEPIDQKESQSNPLSLLKNNSETETNRLYPSDFKEKQSTPVSNNSEPTFKVQDKVYQPNSDRLPRQLKEENNKQKSTISGELQAVKGGTEKKDPSATEKDKENGDDFWGFIDEEKAKIRESNQRDNTQTESREKKQAESFSLKTSKLYSDRIEEDIWGENDVEIPDHKKDSKADQKSSPPPPPPKEKVIPLRTESRPVVLNAGIRESVSHEPMTMDLRGQKMAGPSVINEKGRKGNVGDLFDSLQPDSKRTENDELEF
jgi:hypothetical protein